MQDNIEFNCLMGKEMKSANKVLAFGEVLWDIIEDKAYIGGAPFNLVSHCSRMGIQSHLISAVGRDFLGKSTLRCLENNDIHQDFISEVSLPTGAVSVVLDKNGMPSYTIYQDVAWDNIILSEKQFAALIQTKWDVFCFGTLAQRSSTSYNTLLKILDNIDSQHVFFDINLRQNYFDRAGIIKSLEYSSIVKLNDEEAFFLDDYLFNRQGSLAEFANRISSEYDIEILCITKGADGAEIYTKNEKHVIPGVKVQVADTIGAGDSFCAGFLAAFLASKTLQECGSLAVQIAGFVASQAGAVPEYSAALREVIKEAGLVLEKE